MVVADVADVFKMAIFVDSKTAQPIILKTSGKKEGFARNLMDRHANNPIRENFFVISHGLNVLQLPFR